MREILFRGKRSDGEWAFGSLLKVTFDGTTYNLIFADNFLFVFGQAKAMEHAAVIPETVGQFTGLTDKNGKKIFEGDLLNGFQYPFYRSESDEHNYFAEVIWFDGNCAFGLYTHKHPTAKVKGISAGNADFIEDFNSDDWEVIGNIHDNPELLGGTDHE
jgi:uncharacterized phage protein (TIGR01671 family)